VTVRGNQGGPASSNTCDLIKDRVIKSCSHYRNSGNGSDCGDGDGDDGGDGDYVSMNRNWS